MRVPLRLTVLLFAAGCASQAAPQAESDIAAIYTAVIDGRFHAVPGSTFVIADRTLPMPPISRVAADRFRAEKLPNALLDAVRQSPKRREPLNPAVLPPAMRRVSTAKVEALFEKVGPEGWHEFYREFKAEGWLSLSAVVFSRDRLHACVAYDAYCGGLCGEGGYVWLQRTELSGRWVVIRTFGRWVS